MENIAFLGEYRTNPHLGDWFERTLDEIMAKPHVPTLALLDDQQGLVVKSTGRIVLARKVADFEYLEEEFYHPLSRRCPSLSLVQLDTKILKTLYSKLLFDAYSVRKGSGFDPFYTHVEGSLYKMEVSKNVRKS